MNNPEIFPNFYDGIERDIVKCSYYVIFYFKKKGNEVTNLKLQKLMYLMEAIYIAIVDEKSLYNEDFLAREFGPFCKKLDEKYSSFENYEIELTEDEIKFVQSIPSVNKILIEILYKLFGDWSTYSLVEFLTSKGTPFFEVHDEENNNVIISKDRTKEWFKEKVGLNEGS